MPKPIAIPFGPWKRGLNTATDAANVGFAGAVEAVGVDLNAGILQGMWGLGASVETLTTGLKTAHYAGSTTWVTAATAQWAQDIPEGSYGGSTYNPTVVTPGLASGVGSYPAIYLNGTAYQLGLTDTSAPGVVVNGSSGGARTYCWTFYSPTTGFESNPTNASAEASTCRGATLNLMDTYSGLLPGVNVGTVHRRIYATQEDDPNGIFYYYDTLADDTSTSWTDDGGASTTYAVDLNSPLTWDDEGSIAEAEETGVFQDFNEAPTFTVIAKGMHSLDDSDGAGVLFGAVGNVVQWSHKGKVWAWPWVQRHTLPEDVEAIISTGPQTYAYTQNGIWAFSGAADYALAPIKTNSALGVIKGFGKTVCDTPWGILFISREGLTLFDGNNSRSLTAGLIDPATFNNPSYTYATAEYQDGFYFLSLWGEGEGWVFDLREGPANLKVSKADLDIACFARTPHLNSGKSTLYVVSKADGTVKPWEPAAGSNGGTVTRLTWSYQTAKQAGSQSADTCRWRRVWGHFTGPLTITADATGYKSDKQHVKEISEGETITNFWLPTGFTGRYLSLKFEGTGTGSEVRAGRVEGVVMNGY